MEIAIQMKDKTVPYIGKIFFCKSYEIFFAQRFGVIITLADLAAAAGNKINLVFGFNAFCYHIHLQVQTQGNDIADDLFTPCAVGRIG